MKFFIPWLQRRAKWIVGLAGILAVGGGYYSFLLYRNLRPDMEELLPGTARSVVDLQAVTQRLEATESLAVLVFSGHPGASRRFVDDLASRLERGPTGLIARVEYRITEELAFFRKRQALYMDLADLARIRRYLVARLDYEQDVRNPVNIFSGRWIPEPSFNWDDLRKKYGKRTEEFSRFPHGYYATPDQSVRAVLVYMSGKFSGTQKLNQVRDFVQRSIDELNPRSYADDLTIRYTGGIQNILEEQAVLIGDLEVSTIAVSALVIIAMAFFFRSIAMTSALLLSVSIGTLWTFGVAYFTVGYLNANSAFLASIVIGNGINFGIIFLARYREERQSGAVPADAIRTTMTHTFAATGTAALAAGFSYGSLMLTEFRGFSQFGWIGLIGMLLCWVSAFTVLPALLLSWDRPQIRKVARFRLQSVKKRASNPNGSGFLAFLQRHPFWILLPSGALTVFSIASLGRLGPERLEADMTKVRSKVSFERGSGYYSKYLDQVFNRYLTPVVLLPKSRGQAEEIARRLRELQRLDPDTLITRVRTLSDFLPRDVPAKLKVLADIRSLLSPRIRRGLGSEERRMVAEFLTPESARPVLLRDLPPLIRRNFTEINGAVGNLILVEPPITARSREREPLIRFVSQLRTAADAVAPGTPVVGALPISADILASIERDGPRATLFAFTAVVILVVLLFRRPFEIFGVLVSLILGVLWLTGAVLLSGVKINFLNFIAFPITFGIGVDYGVNIFQRFREEGWARTDSVVLRTGSAVALCSLTTIIGYGSLLLAQNQAFNSFGWVAVIGEITCAFAALFSLPALLALINSRRQRERDSSEVVKSRAA